jgi:hypothetical protein
VTHLRLNRGFSAPKALVLLTLVFILAVRQPVAGTPTLEGPVRVTVIGDSLTQQYGPVFKRIGLEHGVVVGGRWYGGTNPIDHPWSTWVRGWSDVDYVVLQDVYVPDAAHSGREYLTAWQDLVDAARTTLRPGGQVIVMNGNHPDLSSIRGIDRFVDQVTPDDPDGIHWTEAGYTAEAVLLCEQLSPGAWCS